MIRLEVPVYYTRTTGRGKKKKITTSLISFNWYAGMNSFAQRDFKRKYHDILMDCLPKDLKPFEGMYQVEYVYHYKNVTSDLPNVMTILSKVFNDLLQEVALVDDDNVQFLKREISNVGSHDKDNPRMEIIIRKFDGN